MPACERCWADAYMRVLGEPSRSQADHYEDLLRERTDNPCCPHEQSGEVRRCRACREAAREPGPENS
jgi:hypothetical protein